MISTHKSLSHRRQCELLEINRSSLYYKPLGESAENLSIMKLIDRIHTEHPSFGVLRLQDELSEHNLFINHKRVRRLMRKMGIQVIYPKRNLSRLGKAEYIRPYLLRGLEVVRRSEERRVGKECRSGW